MNLHRISHSLVTRLIMSGMAIVVLGTVLRFFILSDLLREDIGELTASQQMALANYVAHDIDQKILQRKELLQRLAQTLPPELLGQPERLRAWLRERQEMLPLFSYGLFVAGVNGRVIADYPSRFERGDINYADRDYFRAALAGDFAVGRTVVGRVAGEPVLPLGVPLRDAGGRVVAVLAGATTLATPGFFDLLQNSRIGQTGGFLLISPRDRLFVAAADPAMVLKPTPLPGVNLLHDRAMAGYRGAGITRNAKGVEEISAIVSVPSADWFVVARLPTKEAFAPVRRVQGFVLNYSIVVAFAFLLLAAAGLLYTFRPLFRAANHADRMTRGEIPLEPLPIVRDDEIGHMTAAFNRLLAKLFDSQNKLDHMAHHDVLTGLPNRLLLADRMRQALARVRRNGTRVALLCLDLDGFKQVNDTSGHEAGDEVLREVAVRLSETVRSTDTLARVGGDEFIILLADVDAGTEVDAACTVAEKCIGIMARPFMVNDQLRSLGTSIGIAAGDEACSVDDLLLAADQAMYRAKEAGRGRYMVADVVSRISRAVDGIAVTGSY